MQAKPAFFASSSMFSGLCRLIGNRTRRRAQRIARNKANPRLRTITNLKFKVFKKREEITFPLFIPFKYSFQYIKLRKRTPNPLHSDQINFEIMSGNEILLHLENFRTFQEPEVVNSLKYLSLQPGQESSLSFLPPTPIKPQQHPFIQEREEIFKCFRAYFQFSFSSNWLLWIFGC